MYQLPTIVGRDSMHLSEPYIEVMVVAVALLLLWWRAGMKRRRCEKKLADSRPSDTMESFVTSFRPEVQPIASAMYAQFQKFTHSGKVPFRKSDRVVQILRMENEDLDYTLLQMAKQFECRKPTKEDDSKFRGRATFEDFVEFIHHLKATQSQW
jgi:hypothetical protein